MRRNGESNGEKVRVGVVPRDDGIDGAEPIAVSDTDINRCRGAGNMHLLHLFSFGQRREMRRPTSLSEQSSFTCVMSANAHVV